MPSTRGQETTNESHGVVGSTLRESRFAGLNLTPKAGRHGSQDLLCYPLLLPRAAFPGRGYRQTHILVVCSSTALTLVIS